MQRFPFFFDESGTGGLPDYNGGQLYTKGVDTGDAFNQAAPAHHSQTCCPPSCLGWHQKEGLSQLISTDGIFNAQGETDQWNGTASLYLGWRCCPWLGSKARGCFSSRETRCNRSDIIVVHVPFRANHSYSPGEAGACLKGCSVYWGSVGVERADLQHCPKTGEMNCCESPRATEMPLEGLERFVGMAGTPSSSVCGCWRHRDELVCNTDTFPIRREVWVHWNHPGVTSLQSRLLWNFVAWARQNPPHTHPYAHIQAAYPQFYL